MKNNMLPDHIIPFLMTPADLMKLGLDEVGYIRRYSVKGSHAFVLHAADGKALAVQNSPENALVSAQHHNIEIVNVH